MRKLNGVDGTDRDDGEGTTRPRDLDYLGVEPGQVLDGRTDLGLSTRYVAARLHYLRSVGSTNAVLADLASEGEPSGTAVLAEEQTGGKGRAGRTWFSPAGGGLWLSVLLRIDVPPDRLAPLSIAVAVAVAESLREHIGPDVRVKWPNDILVGAKKLGGVLVESKPEEGSEITSVVVGLGLNVNLTWGDLPPELADGATSLRESLGREVERVEVLKIVARAIEGCFDEFLEGGIEHFRERWRVLSTLRGRRVAMGEGRERREGTAIDMAASGALVVELSDGATEEVWHGDVSPTAVGRRGTNDD